MITRKKTRARNFSLRGFLKLVRFTNLVIIVFTQYMAGVFLVNEGKNLLSRIADPNLFLLSLSTVLIAAAGYIINDYYDVKIDLINKPHRVVVDRVLKRRIAMIAHTALNFAGIAIGLKLGLAVGLVNFLCAFLLWLYSNQLKRLPLIGNITIGILTGASLAILAVYYRHNEILICTYAVFAFFITVIREIIKDMEDIKGDASFGCKTLPIIYGIRRTKYVIYGFTAIFIAALFSLTGLVLNPKVAYFFFILLAPISWLIIKLAQADTTKEFGYISRVCKFIMLLGVLSMLFL